MPPAPPVMMANFIVQTSHAVPPGVSFFSAPRLMWFRWAWQGKGLCAISSE